MEDFVVEGLERGTCGCTAPWPAAVVGPGAPWLIPAVHGLATCREVLSMGMPYIYIWHLYMVWQGTVHVGTGVSPGRGGGRSLPRV